MCGQLSTRHTKHTNILYDKFNNILHGPYNIHIKKILNNYIKQEIKLLKQKNVCIHSINHLIETINKIKHFDLIELKKYFATKYNYNYRHNKHTDNFIKYIQQINTLLLNEKIYNNINDLLLYVPKNNYILNEYYNFIKNIYRKTDLLSEINNLISYNNNELKEYFYQQMNTYNISLHSFINEIDILS